MMLQEAVCKKLTEREKMKAKAGVGLMIIKLLASQITECLISKATLTINGIPESIKLVRI